MAQYRATVSATGNSSINTEDTWIEMFPPANVSILLKRIRISCNHGTAQDVPIRVRIVRTSAAGATGTAFTPIKLRPAAPASVTTCNVKNGTSAFTVGTAVDVVVDTVFNSRGIFEWVARDESDFIVSGVNQRIIVGLRGNLVSLLMSAECDWGE